MMNKQEIINDPLEITRVLTADAECECARKQKESDTSQFQDIVDLIRGVPGQHEEDIATALLNRYKIDVK